MKTKSNIFLSLLCELEVPHTDRFSLQSYEEHPYKYTFYGLKSLCEKYGIKTEGVLVKEKSEIAAMPVPFVANYNDDYVLVKRVSSKQVEMEIYGTYSTISYHDFVRQWGGCALLFYPDEKSVEPDYKKHKLQHLWNQTESALLIACCLGILGLCAMRRETLTWIEAVYLLFSLLGCAVSTMLLFQQMKIRNTFIENVCHAFKKSSCHNVLENSAAKVFGKYSWAEIGFSYFLVNSICMLLSDQFTFILAYINMLALVYSLWSVWYQRHVSQWCPLCLIVQGVVVSQFVLYLIGGIYSQPFRLHLIAAVVLIVAYIGLGLALNKFLPLLVKSKELRLARWQYDHLRMKDTVFHALAAAEKEYPVDASSLIFGNKEKEMCITVFSNPYCNPCALMHKRLQTLMDSGNCRIQYVFTSFKPEWNDINKYMIALYRKYGAEKAWDVISNWYAEGKVKREKFFEPYHLDITDEKVVAEFESHERWKKETAFNATPTLLVNGRKLPYGYSIEDMRYF